LLLLWFRELRESILLRQFRIQGTHFCLTVLLSMPRASYGLLSMS
jgi:hypothetical protein